MKSILDEKKLEELVELAQDFEQKAQELFDMGEAFYQKCERKIQEAREAKQQREHITNP